MLNRHRIIVLALFVAIPGAAFAGAVDDARSHFKAVAAGQVDKIIQDYAPDAHFEWVGGPLNGAYVGTDKIKEVWTKFVKANAPLEISASRVEESANPAGETVTANVEFKGKSTIKVRYVLTYRNGKLVNEIWQIDPKLAIH
ncbi:MAG TPA: nuclear transport factor 2 family protein [Candidatus Methylomirabilis sp.]|nr:nuclear transport factor 2 family protein [Candidatus Methylomirabilis sp.]